MEQAQIIQIIQDAVYTVLIASAPMLAAALLIGVIISIFQATTQINEQTLAFVPKIIGILLALLLFGGFILSSINEFSFRIYDYMNSMI